MNEATGSIQDVMKGVEGLARGAGAMAAGWDRERGALLGLVTDGKKEVVDLQKKLEIAERQVEGLQSLIEAGKKNRDDTLFRYSELVERLVWACTTGDTERALIREEVARLLAGETGASPIDQLTERRIARADAAHLRQAMLWNLFRSFVGDGIATPAVLEEISKLDPATLAAIAADQEFDGDKAPALFLAIAERTERGTYEELRDALGETAEDPEQVCKALARVLLSGYPCGVPFELVWGELVEMGYRGWARILSGTAQRPPTLERIIAQCQREKAPEHRGIAVAMAPAEKRSARTRVTRTTKKTRKN